MPETTPALPEGWAVTTVEITETTTYRVHVAHPAGAARPEIAAVGYDDYSQELHPETVFDHELGVDEIAVGGQSQDGWDWPAWADRRPTHDQVTAILAADGKRAA